MSQLLVMTFRVASWICARETRRGTRELLTIRQHTAISCLLRVDYLSRNLGLQWNLPE
jgi:hypothetical protein